MSHGGLCRPGATPPRREDFRRAAHGSTLPLCAARCELPHVDDGDGTDGTISSLYGLTHHYIDQAQYTALVTVVILTAVIPTLVAQILFRPEEDPEVLEAEVP